MRRILFLIIVAACLMSSCDNGGTEEHLIIMSWNVQNLFDDVDNGTEYREFDPGLGDWNYDCFNRKASALADVITSSVAGGPDVVLLQEIENDNALRHLNENCLKASSYSYRLFFPTENSAVGTGVLSRFPVESANSHTVNCGGEVKGRNISMFQITLPETGELMVIYINHWKSKLGGAEETEIYRIAAAELLSDLIRQRLDQQSVGILAAGDFNESHDEFSRIGEAYPTAIIAGRLSGSEELELYNPWSDSECSGSYSYKSEWETIDQFFLSSEFFDGEGWDYSGFNTTVLEFNSSSEGFPLGWQASTGAGCSDHFPILLELSMSG
ncbi:MAG TPA: hypothetical protein DCO79_06425 [Spirochaeta sp.]|nr:hypothetical protein [Spirochaeta sp.]